MKPDFTKDGIDHINVFSRGKTELGRLLSNFANTPVVTEKHGRFESVEGYWHYLLTGDEYLRKTYGFIAMKVARKNELTRKWQNVEGFKDNIRDAIYRKIEQNDNVREPFIESTLPFKHYYVFNATHVHEPQEYLWIVDMLEEHRKEFKEIHNKRFITT